MQDRLFLRCLLGLRSHFSLQSTPYSLGVDINNTVLTTRCRPFPTQFNAGHVHLFQRSRRMHGAMPEVGVHKELTELRVEQNGQCKSVGQHNT